MKRVLLFDSGVGGLSVCDAIVASGLPVDIDYVADTAWLPYGDKTDEQLQQRVPALLSAITREWEPDILVMACNTASTIALGAARAAISQPIVGVVPPIKPAAAASRTGVIAILATPATVARPYVDDLVSQFAADKRVIRFGSTGLVKAAEDKLAGRTPDPAAFAEAIDGLFNAPFGDGVDVVALACTHFPLLKDELAAAAPRAVAWLDSGEAIARRVATLLNLAAGSGHARLRRAAFTGTGAHNAFAARGFSAMARIGSAPGFPIDPIALSDAV